MATAASRSSHTPPPKRSSLSASPPSAITKGASARSAVPARVNGSTNGVTRRTSLKVATSSTNGSTSNGVETRESLLASLKRETELKEQLLVRLENKEHTIVDVTKENDQLTFALGSAETRLSELYADQGRTEEEMAARIEVIEKLRTQVRELEKEKRDLHRRYNEQTSTFEAERQAFYDNEQHLKSRIQSLTDARRQPVPPSLSVASELESEAEPDEEDQKEQPGLSPKSNFDDPDSEPAEMTALKLELSTLSTSYTSMQNTLVLLQTQLVDLKRVNNELQEENESYNILLREKTLSGQFDLFKQVGGASSSNNSEQDDDDDSTNRPRDEDAGSLRSTSRSILDPVDERPEGGEIDSELVFDMNHQDTDSPSISSRRHANRQGRKRASSASHSPAGSAPRGESLANLPITGPGLDLAAELGRAENKDILSGRPVDERDRSVLNNRDKRNKKRSTDRNMSLDASSREPGFSSGTDVEALRTEVKALKDANKALSLYASKIIDRIISQEGFEHVLAIDYEKESMPNTPAPAAPVPSPLSPPKVSSKPRPQSVTDSRSNSIQSPLMSPTERLSTFDSVDSPQSAALATGKASRRSMSFDWSGFSLFAGSNEKKQEPNPNLRPLTLKPGGTPVVIPGARKLDTQEDDEDRRERERLAATMKLMGIEKPPISPVPVITKTQSITPTATSSRFSFFRRGSENASAATDDSAISAPSGALSPSMDLSQSGLTQQALAQAEAENSLAALDAHERSLSAEIAKGYGGGFTEIQRSGRRRRSAGGSGSGSTVWSAGMSKGTDED